MPKDQPIRAEVLKWKVSNACGSYFGGIQVILSNGVASPLFLAKDQNSDNLQEIKINSDNTQIRGTYNSTILLSVHFLAKNGGEISKILPNTSTTNIDIDLAEGEEIIGVYGIKDQAQYFWSLGFIVWKPPKF